MQQSKREQYEAPRLEVIGTVSDLTLGSNGGAPDVGTKLPAGQVSP